MQEYEELGHLNQINEDTSSIEERYYLPHHVIFKSSSSTTSTRIVFNGSCRSSNGLSLNDTLLVGRTIQQDLYSIVLRFRTYQIAFTADIAKMYRQVRIHEDNRKLQQILWIRSVDEPLRTYELSTVMYGTASAPYLATRLQQLAEDESKDFSLAPPTLTNNFYVDDALCGANTIEDAPRLEQELMKLLGRGGFHLRKFCASHPSILEAVPPDCREMDVPIELDSNEGIKTLGLLWHPLSDQFLISKGTCAQRLREPENSPVSKRIISSIVATIFDPLGLISPVVVVVYKIFLQQLLLHKLDWDEQLPSELLNQWMDMYLHLSQVNEIADDRLVLAKGQPTEIQLHGFCDSCKKAYGARLYLRSVTQQGEVTTKLLCSKSKVAPVKKITLPRLELCGALLLSQLIQKTVPALNFKIDRILL